MKEEYQTKESQKKLIDENPNNIKNIKPEFLTDEIIYYALSKGRPVLRYVPRDRRSPEICEFAIKCCPRSLRYVPIEFRTFENCFMAVTGDIEMLECVPDEIFNKKFLDALNKANIVIPYRYKLRIKRCLGVNNHDLFSETPQTGEVENNEKNYKLDTELKSLRRFLSKASLLLLNDCFYAYTVRDLLDLAEDNAFFYELSDEYNRKYIGSSTGIDKEMYAAIRLLKCKCLNIDPFIDINSKQSVEEVIVDYGLSSSTEEKLIRHFRDVENFNEILYGDNVRSFLLKCPHMKNWEIQEILYKTSIVAEFYKKKEILQKNEIPQKNDDERIQLLLEELTQARAEIKNLDARIEKIMFELGNTTLSKNEGEMKK